MFLNVYMPFCSSENHDEFLSQLSKIDSIIDGTDTPYIFALGDFNADLNKDQKFGNDLMQFCKDAGLMISDKKHLKDCYTFVSSAHLSTA